MRPFVFLFFFVFAASAWPKPSLDRCGLLIAGHSQAAARAEASAYVRSRAALLCAENRIDVDAFLLQFPSNQIFERALSALLDSGEITQEQVGRCESIEPDRLRAALELQLLKLVSLVERGGGSPAEWRHGLVAESPKERTVAELLKGDFPSLTYAELSRIFEALIAESGAVDSPRLRDHLLEQLWARSVGEPTLFARGAVLGDTFRHAVLSDLSTLAAFEETPTVAGPSAARASATTRAFASAGFALPPPGTLIPDAFWLRAIEELEIHMVALVGRPALGDVLRYEAPGFEIRDLRRELFFQILRWRARGRALQALLSIRSVSEAAARSFLARRGVVRAVRTPEVSELGTPPEGIFLFSTLDTPDSEAVVAAAKALARAKAPDLALDPGEGEAFVLATLDLELALYWGHRPQASPSREATLVALEKIVLRRLGALKRQTTEIGRRSAAARAVSVELRRWRTMALNIPRAVRRLSTRYEESETSFWEHFSESDVLEAVGTEAAEWKTAGYAAKTFSLEAMIITDRAIRRLLAGTAREKRRPFPVTWRVDLDARRTDIFALYARREVALFEAAIRIWKETDEEKKRIETFETVLVENVPSVVVAARRSVDEIDVRRESGFDRVVTIYRLLVESPKTLDPSRVQEATRRLAHVEARWRELSLLYLSRATLCPLPEIFAGMETWAGGQAKRVTEEAWRLALDTRLRELLAARASKPLLVVGGDSGISDVAWQRMAARLSGAIENEGAKFQVTPEQFWERHPEVEVRAAIVAEYRWWKEEKFEGHALMFEETEIVKRAVRKLCVVLFHEQKRKIPDDAEARIARNELDRADVVAMIPRAEFEEVFSAWTLSVGVAWRAGAKERVRIFNDFFVLDVPKSAMRKRNPEIEDDVELYARRGRYFQTFFDLYKRRAQPGERFWFVSPPTPCPYSERVWGFVQQAATRELSERLEAAAAELLEKFPVPDLRTLMAKEIDEFHKRSDSEDTQRRHAVAIAKRIVNVMQGIENPPPKARAARVSTKREAELYARPRALVFEILAIYELGPADFWKEQAGDYTEEDVLARIEVEAKDWVRKGYGVVDTFAETDDVRDRAVRFLIVEAFHRKGKKLRDDWKAKLEKNKTDRQAVIDRLPPSEVERVLKAWDDPAAVALFRRAFLTREPFHQTLLSAAMTDGELDEHDRVTTAVKAAFDEFWIRLAR